MNSVPVLLYHHVAPDREIAPEDFERHLNWLQSKGWRTAGLSELEAHLAGLHPLPARTLMITFDDGYADNWVYAHPLLRGRGFNAVLFPVTGQLRRRGLRATSREGGAIHDTHTGERSPEGFLTWEELRAMVDSGTWEAGSHTHTHRGWHREGGSFDMADELASSRRALEHALDRPCHALAWPWGEYNADWLAMAREAGYALAFTTRVGSNPPGRDPMRVRRLKVRRPELKWLESRLKLCVRPLTAEAYGLIRETGDRLKGALRR